MTSVKNEQEMMSIGEQVGALLRGGEVIELIGDVGAGKTTFVKGVGKGLALDEDVQSPSFTISRVYDARDGLKLHHYDFYRLHDAGVMAHELAESINEPSTITIVEWAETVGAVLPDEHARLTLAYSPHDESRQLTVQLPATYDHLRGTI